MLISWVKMEADHNHKTSCICSIPQARLISDTCSLVQNEYFQDP